MKYLEGRLLAICVKKGQCDAAIGWAKTHGAKGATVMYSRSFSSHGFLRAIGLGDVEMELAVFLQEGTEDFQCSDFQKMGNLTGFALVLDRKENGMKKEFKLITAIVNKGFGDDVAEAARNAGSIGATVLGARGTGTAEDAKFLNVVLVPEKDVVFLVCPESISEKVVTAIRGVKELSAEGSGVVFQSEVSEFVKLGGPKAE